MKIYLKEKEFKIPNNQTLEKNNSLIEPPYFKHFEPKKKSFFLNSLIVTLLLSLRALPSFAQERLPVSKTSYPFWRGFNIHIDYGGYFIVYKPPKPPASTKGHLIDLGGEYGWIFKRTFYFGIDARWTFFIPRTLKGFRNEHKKKRNPKGHSTLYYLLVWPVSHLHFGYFNSKNTLFTLGTTYLWGLSSTIRHPISEHFFFEGRGVWFLDRILKDPKAGLDDFLVTVGVGIHF